MVGSDSRGGYSYDGNGNQTDRYTALLPTHLAWDAENRLSGIWEVAGNQAAAAPLAMAPVAAAGTQSYPYRVYLPYATGVTRGEHYGYDGRL